MDETSSLPKHCGLAFSPSQIGLLNGSNIWARRNNFHALLYLRPWSLDTQTSFPGERYLIKLPSTDSCLIGLILNCNRLVYYSSKIYAPFSDWLKGQRVFTVFWRCEQHIIDSMVYISLETREIDDRSTSFSMRGRLAVIDEWTKKWRSRLSEDEVAEFLTKTARNKCKNIQNISLVDNILLDLHNSLHSTQPHSIIAKYVIIQHS